MSPLRKALGGRRRRLEAGEEMIVVRGKAAELHIPGASVQTAPAARLAGALRAHGPNGLHAEALPDNTKWRVDAGQLTVFIVELKPEVRSILWIAPDSPVPFGPRAKYRRHRVATPYVVMKAAFLGGELLPTCELFYRTRPLRTLGTADEVLFSNLLNVSPDAYGCTAWVCTQDLEPPPADSAAEPSFTERLHALCLHAWGGGFNRSSEFHETRSCFQKAIDDGLDGRVTDIERWEAATQADPSFVLDVAWTPAGVTVKRLIEREIERHHALGDLGDAGVWISLLLSSGAGG
jgi:hypothetical protein